MFIFKHLNHVSCVSGVLNYHAMAYVRFALISGSYDTHSGWKKLARFAGVSFKCTFKFIEFQKEKYIRAV